MQVFEEAMSRFIVESEGIAIAKLKRSANRGGAAAKMKPNPLNESKTREEAQLRDALRRFQVCLSVVCVCVCVCNSLYIFYTREEAQVRGDAAARSG